MFTMTLPKKIKTKSKEASHIKKNRRQGSFIFKLQRINLLTNFLKDNMFAIPSRVSIFMQNIGNLLLSLFLFLK